MSESDVDEARAAEHAHTPPTPVASSTAEALPPPLQSHPPPLQSNAPLQSHPPPLQSNAPLQSHSPPLQSNAPLPSQPVPLPPQLSGQQPMPQQIRGR